MTTVNVFYAAMFAAISAFSSQASSINSNIESGHYSFNKYKKTNSIYVPHEIKLNLITESNETIKKICSFSDKLDELYKNSLTELNTMDEKELNLLFQAEKLYFAIDVFFKAFMTEDKLNLLDDEIKNSLISFHKSYREAGGKLSRLVSLIKQINTVPSYFESEIDFSGLKELAEHSKTIYV